MDRKVWAGLFCLLCIVLFSWLWLRSQQVTSEQVETICFVEAETLNTGIRQVHGDDPAFSATLEEFIRCFNGVFRRENAADYFPDVSRWSCSTLSRGIHSKYPARQYRFCEDETVYSLPTVTVYTPLEEHCIQEITINFDEHSYTEAGFQRYKVLVLSAILTFFPELSKEAAEAIRDEMLSLGSQHVFDSQTWFGSAAVPATVYYKDGIGLYPYDAIGDWRRFCMIPVTQERLEEFKDKGAVLHEME